MEKRSVGVAFSSETPIHDMPGMPPLILLHEPQAVDLEGFRSTGSVLWDHDTQQVIGRPDNPRLDVADRVGRATVVFDDDPESNVIFRKVQSGSIRGVSLRFKVDDGIMVRSDENWTSPGGKTFTGPVAVVTRWTPREISLTPIPADQSVGVGRSLSPKEASMDLTKFRKLMVTRGLVKEDASDDEVLQAMENFLGVEDQKRSAKDDDAGAGETADQPQKPTAPSAANALELMEFARKVRRPDDAIDWLKRGFTIDQARAAVMERMIAESPQIDAKERVEVTADAADKFFAAHGAALTRRANAQLNGKLKLEGDDLKLGLDIPRDISLDEMIRRTCEFKGVRGVRNWDKEMVATRGLRIACSMSDMSRAMQHSTSDFPYVLDNIGNKFLVAGFTGVGSTFQVWSGTLSVSDFKTHTRVNLSEAEQFVVNPELMPISESTVSEKKETYSIQTYARRFGISRQAIINDDLGAFSRIPALFGAAAARTQNTKFYADFIAGKTMAEDSQAWFSASHTSGSNLGSSAAMDVTELAEARTLMRKQKGFNSKDPMVLNLTPTYLLIPAALEQTALALTSGQYMPTAYTAVVPAWIKSLQVIVEPLLDANSTTAFYLICSPSEIDTMSAVYLNGNRTPQMTRLEGTDILGVEWVAYFDFGTAILEHRGIVKHTGAA